MKGYAMEARAKSSAIAWRLYRRQICTNPNGITPTMSSTAPNATSCSQTGTAVALAAVAAFVEKGIRPLFVLVSSATKPAVAASRCGAR